MDEDSEHTLIKGVDFSVVTIYYLINVCVIIRRYTFAKTLSPVDIC